MYVDRTSDFWQAVKIVGNSKNKTAPQLLKTGSKIDCKTEFGKASKTFVSFF